ncbi:MAG: B12-binding domain-containing radical SAM protein [bacterium]|nr:B12-binding domain-containing radical SAM protein [bacterium]
MKILLVAPDVSSKQENQNDFVYFSRLVNKPSKKQTGDKLGVMPLALPTLAALTPPEFDVRIIDENIEDIDFNAPVDIVGITFLTSYARQGYELADRFRDAGVHVALGGVHVTMCVDEALQHADTLFVGEADDTWEAFLNDFKRGSPKRMYKPEKRPDLKRLVIPRWDLVKNEYYRSNLIQTSRGCYYDCDFCSVPKYSGPLRNKPVENVIKEIKATKNYGRVPGIHYVYFADEDVICNKRYAKKLFRAMIPLKVRWVSQVSINIAMDDELLDLAARSGCEAVFIGFESIVQENLDSVGKGRLNKVQYFKEAIDKVHRKGIVVFGFIMFRFDEDDASIFQKTVDFITESPIALPIINILGPLPGTRFYDRMKAEGRLIKADWERFDARNVLITPKKMSADTLQKGVNWSLRKLYSADAVLDRINRLWDIGGLRSLKNYFLARFMLTLLLAFDSLSRDKEFATFIRRMIRELWVKKNISFTVIFAALSFYDFARKLPVVEDDQFSSPTGEQAMQ